MNSFNSAYNQKSKHKRKVVTMPIVNFNPTNISNCVLWLDASDPNGTGVMPTTDYTSKTWQNKIGEPRILLIILLFNGICKLPT